MNGVGLMDELIEEFMTMSLGYLSAANKSKYEWNLIPEKKGYILLLNGGDLPLKNDETKELIFFILKAHLKLYGYTITDYGLILEMQGES